MGYIITSIHQSRLIVDALMHIKMYVFKLGQDNKMRTKETCSLYYPKKKEFYAFTILCFLLKCYLLLLIKSQ